MATPETGRTRHEVEVDAPADLVYRLLADTGAWPWVLPTSLHLEPLGRTGGRDRVRMFTIGEDGATHGWVALRACDPTTRTVSYRQETSWPPVADMGGSWTVEPRSPGTSVLRSDHDFRTVDGDAAAGDWARATLDGFATAELVAFRAAAEREHAHPDARLVLRDSVRIAGRADEVYAALWRAGDWPARMPHVRAARVTENAEAGTQLLELEAESDAGRVLTTRLARVGIPDRLVVFKHLLLPPIGAAHHVRWVLEPRSDGVVVTAEQTVVLAVEGIAEVLGPEATLGSARGFAARELRANARAVLTAVRDHVEAAAIGRAG